MCVLHVWYGAASARQRSILDLCMRRCKIVICIQRNRNDDFPFQSQYVSKQQKQLIQNYLYGSFVLCDNKSFKVPLR